MHAQAPSRDKSILRVAASLQDETHPFASEVASEARLSRERRLASSNSDHPFSSGGKVLGFVLPPSLSLGQRPPFGATPRSWGKGATRRTWEEQDDEDVDPLDTLRFGVDVDSDQSSDDIAEAVWARRDAEPETDAMAMEMDMDLDIDLDGSGAGPSASTAVGGAAAATPAAPRPLARPTSAESIWTEFRESRRASATLSTSLALREQNLSASPGTAVAKRPFGPSSLGAVQDSEAGGSESPLDPVPVQAQTPSTSRATTPVVPSAAPSPAAFPAAFPHWRLGAPSSVTPSSGASGSRTRLGKRKVEDRFEPYATSVYKRRAVSPMHPLTLSSLGSGGIGGPSPTGTPTHPTPGSGTLSAGLLHTRSSSWVPTKKRANSRPRSSRSTSPATATAAAVLTDTASAGGAAINGASGASGARPTTPTSRVMVSPALGPMGVSATPLGTPKMVASTPLAAGSGPGYGSGALGLSLGVNQAFSPGASSASGRLGPWVHRHTEEGQEEEVEEGLSMIDLT